MIQQEQGRQKVLNMGVKPPSLSGQWYPNGILATPISDATSQR
jgi:hypothetical protein